MSVPLRVLIVEDSEDDARLLLRELQRGGYDVTFDRVQTAGALQAALDEESWDLITADYSMPQFSALAARSLVEQRGLDVPFLIVSGSIGEETAVEAMRAGAHDYIMKDNLKRLLPAIERELREAEGRRTRREAEQALRESEERHRRMAEALAEADRRKDEFLAVLAHELRNPIGAISNAVQLVKRLKLAEPLLIRAQEIMERQVTHTTRLLDDLLNVSRIVWGKITLSLIRLDLAQLVRDTTEDFHSEIEAAGLALTLELPDAAVWTEADPTRLAQVIGNLLHNAIKFCERGGRITVRLDVEPGERATTDDRPLTIDDRRPTADDRERSDAVVSGRSSVVGRSSHAVLTVRDTGIGIAPEVLPCVFESLTQADRSMDRGGGGLGLGLPLVKGLVELHGGDVKVRSEGVGRGAEFTIRLPLARPARMPEEGSPLPRLLTRPLRVLIVEDNGDAAESLRALVELWGCRVTVASSGWEALDLAPRFQPEVVLCDLGLPGCSGYDVGASLRRTPATAGARLIAVTGYGQEDDQRRSREAGFERHLTKPVDAEELHRLLAEPSGRRG